MELRVLRYFLAVATEGSITKAANSLHVTQPTLSRQIKELEEELGQQLLIRSSHSVSLTAEGMVLRNRAEEILDMVRKAKAELVKLEGAVCGDVYIGGGETDGMRLIAETISSLRKEYPGIKYHLYSGNGQDVTERLDKGLLDFGVLIQPIDLSKYDYFDLPNKDVWGIIMRNDCPLAQKDAVTKEDLTGIPLICSRQAINQTSTDNMILKWFGDEFEKMNIITTYNLLFNAALLVEQGVGCALTLDKLINNTHNSNLCFKPFAPHLESGLNVVWKKHQLFSPAAKIFLERLKQKANIFG